MPTPQIEGDEEPPFLHSWKRIYLLVLFYLFTLVIVLWLISKHYTCS